MKLSDLQRYILKTTLLKGQNRVTRSRFNEYYSSKKKSPKKDDQINAITKSLERLIKKDLIAGYGVKTREKFYIQEIRLTKKGKKEARKLLGVQMRIPFKTNKKKKS